RGDTRHRPRRTPRARSGARSRPGRASHAHPDRDVAGLVAVGLLDVAELRGLLGQRGDRRAADRAVELALEVGELGLELGGDLAAQHLALLGDALVELRARSGAQPRLDLLAALLVDHGDAVDGA